MMLKSVLMICFLLAFVFLKAQDIKVPPLVSLNHPRYLTGNADKEHFQKLIASEDWAKNIYDQSKKSIEEYVSRHQTDSTWIVSRLMMYWKTRSTDVFIKGGVYDHVAGEAPVPTVKFPGMRGGVSAFMAPRLEDITPYMDDPRGLYLLNRSTNKMDWVEIAQTGNIIEGINNNIMRMAYTASAIYFISGEEKYAKFAFDLFDTYMAGMNYRKEPLDLSHGHHQTLAGLSSFEVIQEVAILNSLTGIYDFLYHYIQQKAPGRNTVYSDVFRKWADLQIAHGVAFNNWNLMQAKNILNIALMLDDDKRYDDGKGNHYYTNYVLNENSQRQWSLKKVVTEGFDPVTGMWNESAGYALGVLSDVVGFVNFFDQFYQLDLVKELPILKKAVTAPAQYLFPNGLHTSFGDAHYGRINLTAAYQMVANARRNHKPEQETYFTAYIRAMQQYYQQRGIEAGSGEAERGGSSINALFSAGDRVELSPAIPAGNINEYITPVFSSSHVSLFNLRNGFDTKNGMMVAMSGSKGNHMHAGGMSMELYGKGYVLAPESGIGTNYFQADYAEYYSQFPAHNTVAVDGISAYPVMKSNHGFEVKSAYPAFSVGKNYFPSVSFGSLYFLEPETQSDQLRQVSIIRTSDSTAYYIDIFRSKRKDGKDKMHDYFYHNIGQQLILRDTNGNEVNLQPTTQLSFGGGHLFAYDYIYDKKSVITTQDIHAVFNLSVPRRENVQMNMWMKGERDREIITARSPRSTAIDRMGLPREIADLPLPTVVIRQSGEAWKKPFVSVFEPSTTAQPPSITAIRSFKSAGDSTSFEGLQIENKDGSTQTIFSSTNSQPVTHSNMHFNGSYAVVSRSKAGLEYLFLGDGTVLEADGFSVMAKPGTSAVLAMRNNNLFYSGSSPVMVTVPVHLFTVQASHHLLLSGKVYVGKTKMKNGKLVIQFSLPASSYTKIELQ